MITGFVNALAILIFLAQLPHLTGGGELVAVGLAMIFILPRFTTAVPAPLVAIVVLTTAVVASGWNLPNVGDEGALPVLGIPSVPFDLDTLRIVAPCSFTLAIVGLLESLMTAKLVDDITETRSDKERETRGPVPRSGSPAPKRPDDDQREGPFHSVTGEPFFASDQELIDAFDFAGDPPRVIIDLSRARVWDASAVAALDALETHYGTHGTAVEITGLSAESEALHTTLSGQLAATH